MRVLGVPKFACTITHGGPWLLLGALRNPSPQIVLFKSQRPWLTSAKFWGGILLSLE